MPVVHRVCPSCRVAKIASPTRRCPACERAYNQRRGSPTARGLGYEYTKKRERILRRDGYTCWRCGAAAFTLDHFIPRSRGGTNEDDNLRAACVHCNYGRR